MTPDTAHLSEDAREKNITSDTYWVPGVNYLGNYGRWSFAEFTDVSEMQDKLEAELEARLSLIREKSRRCHSNRARIARARSSHVGGQAW